jgi:hypothetical protein
VTFILMLAWVVAAVWLWRRASVDGAAGWWLWFALAVIAPVAMYAVAWKIARQYHGRGF